MDSPDEVLFSEDRCEVCGGGLGDEVVIQEFADGSLARLCPECAAGAALDDHEGPEERSSALVWPTEPAEASAGASAEFDPLEKTRELLMPVTDLIALQAEMQSALERLACSLERFATEMLTESQGKTAVESRLQMLERELDKTRARLAETEFLLANTLETMPGALADVVVPAPAVETGAAAVSDVVREPEGTAPEEVVEKTPEVLAEPEPIVPPGEDLWSLAERRAQQAAPEAEMMVSEAESVWPFDKGVSSPAEESAAGVVPEATPAAEAAPVLEDAPAIEPTGVAETAAPARVSLPWNEPPAPEETVQPAPSPREEPHGTGFRIDEVQAAQRYYNESPFTHRIRDVRESLGKPKANLTRVPGSEPRAIITIAWDIVWYQYLVDLRRDLPSTHERVVLHREGMDLDELAYYFKEPNALVNDDGKLDASELEVRLLSDPSALITEMTQAEMQALEDATEEIWDRHTAPEFKWDD